MAISPKTEIHHHHFHSGLWSGSNQAIMITTIVLCILTGFIASLAILESRGVSLDLLSGVSSIGSSGAYTLMAMSAAVILMDILALLLLIKRHRDFKLASVGFQSVVTPLASELIPNEISFINEPNCHLIISKNSNGNVDCRHFGSEEEATTHYELMLRTGYHKKDPLQHSSSLTDPLLAPHAAPVATSFPLEESQYLHIAFNFTSPNFVFISYLPSGETHSRSFYYKSKQDAATLLLSLSNYHPHPETQFIQDEFSFFEKQIEALKPALSENNFLLMHLDLFWFALSKQSGQIKGYCFKDRQTLDQFVEERLIEHKKLTKVLDPRLEHLFTPSNVQLENQELSIKDITSAYYLAYKSRDGMKHESLFLKKEDRDSKADFLKNRGYVLRTLTSVY